MIVKPTTGAGSFNIKIINSEVDLQDVKEMISTDEHTFSYEIDEFISGKCTNVIPLYEMAKLYFVEY